MQVFNKLEFCKFIQNFSSLKYLILDHILSTHIMIVYENTRNKVAQY